MQIQLLRAIAVIWVISFHLGIEVMRFGYLGVDIFFVISGFLMRSLYSEIGTRQSNIRFWLKRLQRLVPSFTVVSLIFLLLFWMRSLPFERSSIAREYLFSGAFVSNFLFWTQDQYFSSNSLRPFLHTWSLSIEVQFYALFPAILILQRHKLRIAIGVMFSSFLSYIFIQLYSPNTSFFLLPFRIWEFMLGIFAANFFARKLKEPTKRLNEIVLLTLLFLMPIVFSYMDSQTSNLFALFLTLMMTVLVLIKCSFEWKSNSIVIRVLGFVGDRSYVYYLVHFPLIVLLNYVPLRGNNLFFGSLLTLLIYLSILVCLSEFIYKYVDSKRTVRLLSRRQLFVLLLVPLTIFSSSNYFMLSVFKSENEKLVSASQLDRTSFRCGTISRIQILQDLRIVSPYCKLYDGHGKNRYLLIGNSHADSIKTTVAQVVKQVGGDFYLVAENMNLNSSNLKSLLRVVEQLEPSIIIFHSSHNSYDFNVLRQFLHNTSKEVKDYFFIESIPTYAFNIPERVLQEVDLPSTYNLDFFQKRNSEENKLVNQLAEQYPIHFVSTVHTFCQTACKVVNPSGNLLYFDSNHLTLTGARLLEPVLFQNFIEIS